VAAAEIELWQRLGGHIGERIKHAKLGCGQIHLPLGTLRNNRGWQLAAVIAVSLVAMVSAVLIDALPKPPVSGRRPRSRRGSRGVRRAEPPFGHHGAPLDDRRPPAGSRAAAAGSSSTCPSGWLWADRIIAVYERLRLIPLLTWPPPCRASAVYDRRQHARRRHLEPRIAASSAHQRATRGPSPRVSIPQPPQPPSRTSSSRPPRVPAPIPPPLLPRSSCASCYTPE
jgi:hypothetical protein